MFNFNKIGMKPSYFSGYKPAATDAQIIEIEKHCGHNLPENLKTILRNYNAGEPEAKYFEVINPLTGLPGEMELYKFYHLDDKKEIPENIWWIINNYSQYIGPNTLPFADDGEQQFYYIKWVNNIPQVWFLAYLDLDEPESYFVMGSFDELLDALYASE